MWIFSIFNKFLKKNISKLSKINETLRISGLYFLNRKKILEKFKNIEQILRIRLIKSKFCLFIY